MAEKTLNTVIVLRNDKSTDWATSNVILRAGELGVSYIYDDNGKIANVIVKAGNGTDKFAALPQVESVLESDLMLTYSFGKHKVEAGKSLNAGGTGMTMSQWIADSLKETVEPTIKRYPNASLSASCSNKGASLEIGSYITSVSYTGSLSEDGDYAVGDAETPSGIKSSDLSWEVTLGDDTTTKKTTSSGSYTTNIQINSTTANTVYATVKAKATLSLDNVVTPTNNLGEANTEVKIKGFENGTIEKSLSADVKASGYRNAWKYIGTDDQFELNSANIRSKATAMNSNTTAFGTVTIPGGTKRVMFAVLGDKTLKSVIDVDGQNLDVKANFTKETIAIEGANGFEAANYSVFHFENSNGVAATKYTVSFN